MVPNAVPGAVEFANARVSRNFVARNPGAKVIKKAGNWFISTDRSLAADTGTLKVVSGSKSVGADSGGASKVALAVGMSVLGYALWRRYH